VANRQSRRTGWVVAPECTSEIRDTGCARRFAVRSISENYDPHCKRRTRRSYSVVLRQSGEPFQRGAIDFDIMGFSYYPDNSKSIDDLKTALLATIDRYHKPILVVETAYPSVGDSPDANQLIYQQYGISPTGQKNFLADLVKMVKTLPAPYGKGVLYWAPEWLGLPGLPSYAAEPLFDQNFNALPALDSLSPNQRPAGM